MNIKDPSPGLCYYTDGEEIIINEYDGIDKKYNCGREYVKPSPPDTYHTVICVIDSNEASVGLTNGERIKILWYGSSMVPKKHHMGGASQMRFNRSRQESLKRWISEVADVLFQEYDNKDIIIGGPGMVKDRLVEKLHSYVKPHVKEIVNCSYTNENGLYEVMRLERYI